MMKKPFVGTTQIVQAELTIRSLQKSVFGALTIAGKSHVTAVTISGQMRSLCPAKKPLPWRSNQIRKTRLHQITEPKIGVNKVVAAVNIPSSFQSHSIATFLPEQAQT